MFQEEQPRRKPRIPLSPEELFYFKKLKELKELKRIQDFKKTSFYRILNFINIGLAAFLAYCLVSILVCCYWESNTIAEASCSYADMNRQTKTRSISEVKITSNSDELIMVKTDELFQIPTVNETFYIGRDFLFRKIIKIKFSFDDRTFWHIYTYPTFIVCLFALAMGFFIYNINKHLSVNGLLTVFGLFTLASLYFVLI